MVFEVKISDSILMIIDCVLVKLPYGGQMVDMYKKIRG
jgi:hypothetical protein